MNTLGVIERLLDGSSRSFAVQLWNGKLLAPTEPRGVDGRVALRSPRVLPLLLPPVSERQVAEAFIDGDIELEGSTSDLLEAVARWEGPAAGIARMGRLGAVFAALAGDLPELPSFTRALLGRRHSIARDRASVQHHYDASDALYRLFLDRELVYSCAYFPEGTEDLERAQKAKLELVCRKLSLEPGERFLDVGCGWGALICHAAREHRARGLGITLSVNQLDEARQRIARIGGPGSARVRGCDWRQLEEHERFEKIASVGMMEHVGRAQLQAYFDGMYRLLEPGGLFLNHAIADLGGPRRTLGWASGHRGRFIERVIFPDAELLPIGEVVGAAERAGFEVRDLESLREHYEKTLGIWLMRLEARFREASALVGLSTARAYRLYLASSQVAFRLGRIGVFQLLLGKRDARGRTRAPWSRAAWTATPFIEPTAEPAFGFRNGAHGPPN